MLWWYTARAEDTEEGLVLHIATASESLRHAIEHLTTDTRYGVYSENDVTLMAQRGWHVVYE